MRTRSLALVIPTAFLAAALSLTAAPASAQAAKAQGAKPAAGVPRTADGHPDLGGFWDMGSLRFGGNLAQVQVVGPDGKTQNVIKESEVPYTPAGREAFSKADLKNDPTGLCLPPGIPRMLHSPFPMLMMQGPGYVTQLFEYQRIWRIIYTDGRPHHADVTDSFMGDSIGHWEGDTLVVETVGMNDRTWLDTAGHQHSADMRVIERITRTAADKIAYEVTVDDPKMYSKPWTHKGDLKPIKATKGLPELLEYFCTENNIDVPHLITTPSSGAAPN